MHFNVKILKNKRTKMINKKFVLKTHASDGGGRGGGWGARGGEYLLVILVVVVGRGSIC